MKNFEFQTLNVDEMESVSGGLTIPVLPIKFALWIVEKVVKALQ
ncbi:hypothetical protein [Limibacterium fermenti]|jgi:bacteriocin-like protein